VEGDGGEAGGCLGVEYVCLGGDLFFLILSFPFFIFFFFEIDIHVYAAVGCTLGEPCLSADDL
jgi:hypothetical protein